MFNRLIPSSPRRRPQAVPRLPGEDNRWPTYYTSKTHGLHQLPCWALCSSCKKINSRVIADSECYVLLNDCWHLKKSAIGCRFCAFVYQALDHDLEAALAGHGLAKVRFGLPRTRSYPLCLSLEAGVLRAYVVAPSKSSKTERCLNLAEFSVYLSEDDSIGNRSLGFSHSCRAADDSPGADHVSPLLPPPWHGLRLDTEEHFDHSNCPIQDRAEAAVAAVDSVLESLPPSCICYQVEMTRGLNVNQASEGYSKLPPMFGPVSPPPLPTRVIDLSNLDMNRPSEHCLLSLHLPQSEAFADYAALSHRWGGQVPFMTTKMTLEKRVEGFRLDELPRSFQDAVLVAGSMGLKFLWIDSLCIIQDDQQDWLEQSRRMGEIFAKATVTIAAHSAAHPNYGFLGLFLVPDFLRVSPKDGSGGFTIRIGDGDLAPSMLLERFEQSCIMSRAWVLQELSLAPRILHFVEDRVLWECYHKPLRIGDALPDTWARKLLHGRLGGNHHDYWYALVAHYSHCDMTEPDDKLVAVAGIVGQLNDLFSASLYHDYHCGVFNTDIERGILWFSKQKQPGLRKQLNRAASWSWASVDGALGFACHVTPEDAHVSSRIVIKSFAPGAAQAVPFEHEPQLCRLVIEGLLIGRQYAVCQRELSSVPMGWNDSGSVGAWTVAGSSAPERVIAWEIVDSRAAVEKISSQIKCVVISRLSSGSTYLGSWMLLLAESKLIPGAYQRVGFGCLLDEDVLDTARREVVTLV
jgi:hypothetical protein